MLNYLMPIMALMLAFSFSLWSGFAANMAIEGSRVWAAVWAALTSLVMALSFVAGGVLL